MLIILLIGLTSTQTDLPFSVDELVMTSPSNILVYDVNEGYIEDILMQIPGVTLNEGRVYFFDCEVFITEDGLPAKIEDIIPQSIERVEFLGEPSLTYRFYPILNFITKRYKGYLPESNVWVRTGDTLGFALKRSLFEKGDINFSGRFSETPLYEATAGYEWGDWKIRGFLRGHPSLEIFHKTFKIRLSSEYQRIDTYFNSDLMSIGLGLVIDTSFSIHAISKIALSPLVYIVPQVVYHDDSISPKLSAGFIPYYEAIVSGWYTPSQYGCGIRFKRNSLFFQSPDCLGLLLQYGYGQNIRVGMNYDTHYDKVRLYIGIGYPFKNGKLVPGLYLKNNHLELFLKIIDVDITMRIKGEDFPIFNISWHFID